MSIAHLVSERARRTEASGIRRVFELGARLKDPINLSIGQPDFPVPEGVKNAAIAAIRADRNGYTLSQGIPELREAIAKDLEHDIGWRVEAGGPGLIVTAGTSGAIMLAMLALLNPGDEIILPDPYFVAYPHMARLCDARAVLCPTYPDFRLTASRVEPLITARTKAVMLNSPGNPTGVVASERECVELLELCRDKRVLLISDEIYDRFTFSDGATSWSTGTPRVARCPSPARLPGASGGVLLVRGFGKTYGLTGWRMGYAAGPRELIDEMTKLQQYTYVCAPSMAQWGCIAALTTDMGGPIAEYQSRRDMVVSRLSSVTDVASPGGAFYAFPRVPESAGGSGTRVVERAVERGLLVIPGGVFSTRDTHLRLSFAAPRARLERGLDILCDLFKGG